MSKGFCPSRCCTFTVPYCVYVIPLRLPTTRCFTVAVFSQLCSLYGNLINKGKPLTKNIPVLNIVDIFHIFSSCILRTSSI